MSEPIVHVVLGLDVGGLERVVLALLRRLDRRRFQPVVVALDEPGALAPELGRIGVPLRVMGRAPGLDLDLARRLATVLRGEGAHLVHTHNPTAHLYGALAAHLAGVGGRGRPKIVHTKHGRNEIPEPPSRAPRSAPKPRGPALSSARRRVILNRLSAALSDRVVAVGDDTASVAVEIERVPAGKVVTIGNGVDTAEFRPRAGAAAARAHLGAPTEGFHVGCVARLAPVKDHRTLLEAFARLRTIRPDAHLTLVGDGPERAALEEHAALLDLEHAVTFAGERAEVAPLLAAFDVFALASRSEGISLTLLEAASSGLPVVATRVGGNEEVVIEGKTGFLVPAGDPAALANGLAAVAERPDRATLGAAGRARVERRFSVERMARAYGDLYAEVLGIA